METDITFKRKLSAAVAFRAQGKHLHAIQIYEQLIQEYPEDPNLHFDLAELYELSGNLNSSINLLESYLLNNKANPDAKFFYGQYLLKKELWEKAIEIFSTIRADEQPLAVFYLGYAYFMLKDFELARINFLTFLTLKVDPEMEYQSYLYLAKTELELNDFERALEYAKKSELFFNSYWELHKILAICYSKLGMDTHAILAVEKSIKLNPKEVSLFELAGRIFQTAKDYNKAENYFTKYVESSDHLAPETLSNLGETYICLGKIQKAQDYFELALKIDPQNKAALNGIEKIKKINSSVSN